MLFAQLADTSDVLSRLLAIEQLQSRADHETVAKLKSVLQNDPFYGVRLDASKALRGIHTEEAFQALLASTRQSDARVRKQVVADLGGFFRDATREEMLRVVREEKNPDIVVQAIGSLGAYAEPAVREVILRQLRSTSYRNQLADAAIRAMRAQDNPVYIQPLLETLGQREADFQSSGFGAGLETLAWLARGETNKAPVREFLAGRVNHKKKSVAAAAIAALGTLGDTQAVPLLETFLNGPNENRERKAVERAVEAIRASRKPSAELGDLRKEMSDLQKDNRDLRKEMEALKKKVETSLSAKTNAPAKPVRPPVSKR